jgi:hypothetical protein
MNAFASHTMVIALLTVQYNPLHERGGKPPPPCAVMGLPPPHVQRVRLELIRSSSGMVGYLKFTKLMFSGVSLSFTGCIAECPTSVRMGEERKTRKWSSDPPIHEPVIRGGVCSTSLRSLYYGAICLQILTKFLQDPAIFSLGNKILVLLYVVSEVVQKISRFHGKTARYYVW